MRARELTDKESGDLFPISQNFDCRINPTRFLTNACVPPFYLNKYAPNSNELLVNSYFYAIITLKIE